MRRITGIFAGIMLAWSGLVAAEHLDMPQGDPVLIVTGKISHTNVDDTARFDREMLSALPAGTYKTSTIWTEGENTFVGVPLAVLLEAVGAEAQTVLATAINDYTVEIPVSSITPQAPIIAYLLNDAPMSRRQKGPLWIVYPYDSDPEFRSEVVYSRSIWQLDRLEMVE
ncbi:molybdopterin-dependent oxidoreductase [uncultured Roseobacter sp.]|uniref:molybdopterin-dependent oxidoreductase n=1 Tax=uncultured Roseobacter sp. TaxID=114847 RepID=UPI002602BB12|nr:molybdopterin-dependent oxidoreductase [uncultured Roseobacter sp.]